MLLTLSQTPAAKTLPRNFLMQLFVGSPPELMQRAKDVSEELARPPADVQLAVTKKLAELSGGDPVRGMQVFRSKKASCSACHKVGDFGTDVDPELTKIGGSRTGEALLEAIMFPNARLEQSYRSTMVMTIDGELHNGLVGKEDGDRLTLVIGADRSVVVPKDEIEERRDSDISVMPGGLAEQLTQQELSDLIAFLKSAK